MVTWMMDWREVEDTIERIAAESAEPFAPKTVGNAEQLVSICRGRTPLPDEVCKGYWSTFCFSWPGFEIEVCEDRLEVYHFHSDGTFSVWYEELRADWAYSSKFLAELPNMP